MILPASKVDTTSVELSGGTVEVRGLTIAESRDAGQLDGPERIAAAIAHATGNPLPEVLEWVGQASAGDVTKLLNAITEASGLTAEAQFPQ